ncbi:hypothetical protein [Terrabacter sp. Ter38]|uniref:hypothetical protein n=1 Tax=Terrabacter sp. Ter38 TaxID=2926030 RepID=UPI00211991C7|nr:hypothetical protein [Terrabacter sp. Ter38]
MRDLSVVVSAHGSCDRVSACLGALAAQTLPADRFEVVVVIHGRGSSARDAVAGSPGAARNGPAFIRRMLDRWRAGTYVLLFLVELAVLADSRVGAWRSSS